MRRLKVGVQYARAVGGRSVPGNGPPAMLDQTDLASLTSEWPTFHSHYVRPWRQNSRVLWTFTTYICIGLFLAPIYQTVCLNTGRAIYVYIILWAHPPLLNPHENY